jgi:hypothetical protein
VPSDQSAAGTLVGTLGGLVDPRELLTSCPLGTILGVDLSCKANSVQGAGVARRAAPQPALVFSARRAGRGRWRVSMRVQDATRAVVTLRCRRGGRQIRALQRRISSRRTTRATVRCDTRPRATAVLA